MTWVFELEDLPLAPVKESVPGPNPGKTHPYISATIGLIGTHTDRALACASRLPETAHFSPKQFDFIADQIRI